MGWVPSITFGRVATMESGLATVVCAKAASEGGRAIMLALSAHVTLAPVAPVRWAGARQGAQVV
eukprot:CAMPEP_0115847202 /NCGR_PEP_ID=MMETSP0287-20121206/10262_1 /TAXON_ID=412157 /ORGANISM="Chrysochromulina rotalis, Strain UIO044" /LENGTH=63 /DNA_ID=CAMNT_0003301031 /DNA_START=847 /DNA_END=1039 /DNA_ORIENTATION=-